MYQSIKNNKMKKIIKPLAIILSILVAFFVGNYITRYGIVIGKDSDKYGTLLKYADDVEQFKGLYEVKEDLEKLYVGDIDQEKLVDGAIKGMTSSLNDPYTVFMNKEEYDRFMQSNSGEFKGIGVYVKLEDDKVVVDSTISGGPAEKVGIKGGDVILKVDGEEVGNDQSKAVALITGAENSQVNIIVGRKDTELEFNVTRETIKTVSVKNEMLGNNIGYINLSTFNKDVSVDFVNALEEPKGKGMKGLILDLRGNGGGYLVEAINIASQFVPKDEVITYRIDKYGSKEISKSEGGVALGLPLVILTDGGTASASEVVTGALKDYNAAVTVGTTTFGKGVVQLPFELKSGIGGLKVTVSKYYTPKGEDINKKGIIPDYEVKLTEEDVNKEYNKDTDPQLQKGIEVIKDMIN